MYIPLAKGNTFKVYTRYIRKVYYTYPYISSTNLVRRF